MKVAQKATSIAVEAKVLPAVVWLLASLATAATNVLYGPASSDWPTQWIPIASLNDPADSGVEGRLDFVGADPDPCGFWYQGTNYLFFRMRVKVGTVTPTTYSDNLWIFVDQLGFNYGGNQTGQPDYALAWDIQQNHGMEFMIWSQNGPTWGQVKMDDIDGNSGSKVIPPDINETGDGRIRSVDGIPTTNFGTTAFLDWAISWSYLASNSTLARGQEWRIMFGSSKNQNDHVSPNADVAGGFSLASPTTSSWSAVVGTWSLPPTRPSSNLTFSGVSTTQMTLAWVSGNGSNRIVVANTNLVSFTPENGTSYVANANFSVAPDVGGGHRVIYNGNGTSVTVVGLSPAVRYYFVVYEYNGSNLTANYLTSSSLAGNEQTLATFRILSAYGTCTPPAGLHAYAVGASLTNSVTPIEQTGGTRYVAVGWQMTGNAPLSGETVEFSMTLTNNAVLTWLWVTQYQFSASVEGQGQVQGSPNGWYAPGSSVTVTAVPEVGHLFLFWTGDAPPHQTNEAVLTLTMDQPRFITAHFEEALQAAETLFLAEGTNLFQIVVTNAVARLERLASGGYDVEPLGASSTVGGWVYFIVSNQIIAWDVLTQTQVVTDIGVPYRVRSSQGDLAPDGRFFFTDSRSNELWCLDLPNSSTSLVALKVGPLRTRGGLAVQLHGGDLAFDSNGTVYVWSNWPLTLEAPRGLYRFHVPPLASWPTNLFAVMEPASVAATGMAVPLSEPQRLLLSTWPRGTIVELAASNAQVVAAYRLQFEGSNYLHKGGDMARVGSPGGTYGEIVLLGESSNLFRVTLSGDQAVLAWEETLPIPVGVMGGSTGPAYRVYVLSGDTLLSYDLETRERRVAEVNVPMHVKSSQGDIGPDGRFYFTDSTSNELWVLDVPNGPTNLTAMRVGPLLTKAGLPVQVRGGDLGFDANGRLYLWSNWPVGYAAPRGLYAFDVPDPERWPTAIVAVVEPPYALATGLAIPKRGTPVIWLSDWPSSSLVEIDPGTFQVRHRYPMELDGTAFVHMAHGDMAVGVLSGEVPRQWLKSHGLMEWGYGLEALVDRDGDGLTAWQEYVAGTDPTRADSVLWVVTAEAQGPFVVVRWPSVVGRRYDVERVLDLGHGTFQPVTWGVPATPPLNVYTDHVASLPAMFYRIRVLVP